MAQTNEELFRDYQFDFTLPGARANGMGGAFIGLADDASASFTNPAGLAFLNETAVTLEYRNKRLDALSGNTTGPVNFGFEQEEASLVGYSFLSLNFRLKSWYFGLFTYDYLGVRQERNFTTRGLDSGSESRVTRRISLRLEGRAHGVGIARRFGRWKAGMSVNYLDMTGETDYTRSSFLVSFPPALFVYNSAINDRDTDWGYNIGLLHEPRDDFSWGVVWREHPRFALQERVRGDINNQPLFEPQTLEIPFVVPDVLGFGLRYRVRPQIAVLADWQRIFYSEIIDDGFRIVESFDTEKKENYTIGDSNELHLGFEWLLAAENSVWALRGGYYLNPRHAVSYIGDNEEIRNRFAETGLRDENHFTFGVGWVYRNMVEVDVSANLWETGKEYTVSLIWRRK